MKLLLLGSGGQLGQAFVHQPQWAGWQSLALSRTQLDLCDSTAVSRVFSHYRPDIVINCAAYTAVDRAEQQQQACMAVNMQAVQYLAQQCQRLGALLVHFSTDYVFDGAKGSPYLETDNTGPLNIYGQSKLHGEHAVAQQCDRHLIIRTSWLFSQFGHNFYRTMRKLAQHGNNISVVDDQFGSPTYAGDIAAIVLQLLQRYQTTQQLIYGLYHLAGGPEVSWYQFAVAIFAAHRQQVNVLPVSSVSWQSAVLRPQYSVLDCSKFSDTFAIAQPQWQNALTQLTKENA